MYNAGGTQRVRDRARANIKDVNATPGDVISEGRFPLYYLDLADNGNYRETNEVAKRATPCGDPRLVKARHRAFWPTSWLLCQCFCGWV